MLNVSKWIVTKSLHTKLLSSIWKTFLDRMTELPPKKLKHCLSFLDPTCDLKQTYQSKHTGDSNSSHQFHIPTNSLVFKTFVFSPLKHQRNDTYLLSRDIFVVKVKSFQKEHQDNRFCCIQRR